MFLGPVFHVEMLGLGRRRRYFLTRVVYALFLLTLMGICYSATFTSWRSPTLQMQAEFAREFFVTFSWVQLIAVLGLTPTMLAGTIAGEHERRTIDYLLTTSLGDAEISLGKFAARLTAIGAQLAVGLPILAITMSLGGIAPRQLFRSFAVSLLTLASLGAMSLAVSTRSRTSRDAVTRCYLILFALLIVPPALWGIAEGIRQDAKPNSVWAIIGNRAAPVFRGATELNPVGYMAIALFDLPIGNLGLPAFAAVHLGVAAVLTAASVFGLRRFYVRQANKGAPVAKVKRRWGVPQLGERPMWWKERVAGRSGVKLGWFGRLASLALYSIAVYLIGWAFYQSLDRRVGKTPTAIEAFAIGGVPAIACLSLLLVTARTAGSLTSERERDTWITLLGTPLEAGEIVRAKLGAALYSLRYWYLLIVATWVLCIVIRPDFLQLLPALIVIHAVMLCAGATLGIICSLASKTSLRAMGTALGLMVLGTWIGPAFLAAVFRAKEFICFSPPFALGAVQVTTLEYLTATGDVGRNTDEVTAVLFIAALGYAALAGVLYWQSIERFDEWAGRIVPRHSTSIELKAAATSAGQTTGEATAEVEAVVETEGEA